MSDVPLPARQLIADAAHCRAYSAALCRGLVSYRLMPNEVLLLLILEGETFARNLIEGKVDLDAWARRLRLTTAKLEKRYWQPVVELLIVDSNEGQGTFQLRPFMQDWSRVRGLRNPNNLCAEPELPLVAERPLDDALSSLSREKALSESGAAPSGGPAENSSPAGAHSTSVPDWAGFRNDLTRLTPDELAKKYPPVKAGEILALPGQSAVSAKTAQTKSVAVSNFVSTELSQAAWLWLQSIDGKGRFADALVTRQWQALCANEPAYVLQDLRRRWEKVQREVRAGERRGEHVPADPISYLSRKALDARKLEPLPNWRTRPVLAGDGLIRRPG
ncbi:MAG: hypothetical protein JWQ04_2765 [Pedosphaera sp.]|nr:hypothetical protein [Pedosphaera sp.]